MAKIVLSADAPDEAKTFSLANATFDVPFETDDPEILGNANAHPWLQVEADTEEAVARYRETGVDPATDPLSGQHPNAKLAFDEEAAEAFEAEKAEAYEPTAIEAGKDQDEVVVEGGVSTTVAAADEGASRFTFTPDSDDEDTN